METILDKESRAAIELMIADGIITKDTVERYFPELKESEDKRIRKALISILKSDFEKDTTIYDISIGDIIAWLEKQGKHANFRNKIQVGDKVTRNEDGVLVNLSQLNRVAKKDEKQGEQKTIWHNEDEEPQRGSLILLIMQSGNPIVAKVIEPNHTFNHGERWAYIDDLLEKHGEQKPIDKVEPKFDVGDKIQYLKGCGTIMTIEKIENGEYIFANNMGHITIESGNKWHLVEQKFAKNSQETKPNGGIVCEDFNEGDGYYKVNLAYLSKSQVELIENLIASWQNPTNNTTAWSEEDERMLDEMYEFFDTHKIPSLKHPIDDYAKFIKHLKEKLSI